MNTPSGKASTDSGATGVVRVLISITGVVQGVGFRPFIYQKASSLGLCGSVINTSAGVTIDVEGPAAAVETLISSLPADAPPRAVIGSMAVEGAKPEGRRGFEIGASARLAGLSQLVCPDSCTCDDCLAELREPAGRRFRYPFINCTNCGPRFTIIEDLPYDRPLTTMKNFDMCDDCRAEYEDPADRRFHAEPNACPVCGPSLWLADHEGVALPVSDAIEAAAAALRDGQILAIKSLGGFQLACLATDEAVVGRLRRRKRRPHKPFALMAASIEDAAMICHISAREGELLAAVERPIVLLRRHADSGIAASVAPGLAHLGVMLPYTPLHFLLMDAVGTPLVMTSGNLTEEPICRTNAEAIERLAPVADLFLLHNRGIRSTYDDSVFMVEQDRPLAIRRARGYAPLPVRLPRDGPPLLAGGAGLKNTFCLSLGRDAFVSQHIGDLENAETLLHYERTESLYERLFSIRPEAFACDRHPDYLSSIFIKERNPEPLQFQHHRAHVAACLADNGFTGAAVGVALDGTGLGDDGAIWGGEFFTGGLDSGLERAAHLEYFQLLGGEAAIHEPWRTALALVWKYAPGDLDFVARLLDIPGTKQELLMRQLKTGLNCPQTSSFGRLVDGAAALALGRHQATYEAQAAVELEAAAWRRVWKLEAEGRQPGGGPSFDEVATPAIDGASGADEPRLSDLAYRFSLNFQATPWTLSPQRSILRLIADLKQEEDPEVMALRFHLGLAEAIVRTSTKLAEHHGLRTAALSGGVFQNRLLSRLVREGLAREGLEVLGHQQLPPNDGCISYGQAVLARYAYKE